jgi:hypothetical protein
LLPQHFEWGLYFGRTFTPRAGCQRWALRLRNFLSLTGSTSSSSTTRRTSGSCSWRASAARRRCRRGRVGRRSVRRDRAQRARRRRLRPLAARRRRCDLVRALRDDEVVGAIPVIAATGLSAPVDHERAMAAGFSGLRHEALCDRGHRLDDRARASADRVGQGRSASSASSSGPSR